MPSCSTAPSSSSRRFIAPTRIFPSIPSPRYVTAQEQATGITWKIHHGVLTTMARPGVARATWFPSVANAVVSFAESVFFLCFLHPQDSTAFPICWLRLSKIQNCAIKPPAPAVLRDRHRRLCIACQKSHIGRLVQPAQCPDAQLLSDTMQRAVCTCTADAGVWLCQPCGRGIRGSDSEYRGYVVPFLGARSHPRSQGLHRLTKLFLRCPQNMEMANPVRRSPRRSGDRYRRC